MRPAFISRPDSASRSESPLRELSTEYRFEQADDGKTPAVTVAGVFFLAFFQNDIGEQT